MNFEIAVDLPEDVLKEWEPVAFRRPINGDWFYIHGDKKPVEVRKGFEMIGPFLILRRRFQWPAWLKCRYLVWDADGVVNGCDVLPNRTYKQWLPDNTDDRLHLSALPYVAERLGISFPGGDWGTRIEENPNWSKTDDARRD